MPLPVPNLDDRRFEDLVKEARARLATHLPELTMISPGDPVHAFIDVFAWLTETILYRANLIPERQRRVFLNLLQIPVRPARPGRGLVCVDANATSVQLAPLLKDGSQLRGGKQSLTVLGELQPTCLSLRVVIKKILSNEDLQAMDITPQDLHEQFGLGAGEEATPFQPRQFDIGRENLNLSGSLDQGFYLACVAPRPLEAQLSQLRESLAGIILNMAIAPADEVDGDIIHDLAARRLVWELINSDSEGNVRFLPVEVIADSSKGGRQPGVVRLRLPKNPQLFDDFAGSDPMFTGLQDFPPALDDSEEAARVALWLRLRCPDDPDLTLGYLGLNGADVIAQGRREDQIVGMGTGLPDQVIALPDRQIDTSTIELDVEENGQWVRWYPVDFLSGHDVDARVFRLNADSGYAYFGDGVSNGLRPREGARIRVAHYRHGGGSAGNLAAGMISEIVDASPRFRLRHEWPLKGGVDAETVADAEQRIPRFLTHRNRAVTAEDYRRIAESNPVNPVARAEVLPGFLPGNTIQAARRDVPGAVSVFVLPPGAPGLANTPRPTKGLLKDVFGYLLQRTLVGTELYVLSPDFVPLAVSVKVQVRDPETEQETLRAVRQALVRYLWPVAPGGAEGTGWPLGRKVTANELATQVARVQGVQAFDVLALFSRGADGWRRLDTNEALELKDYQLPELLGVRVETGTDTPALPDGIGAMVGAPTQPGRGIAVPVIPDVC